MPPRITPAERVERLRKQHGSHDKLAAKLGTTRQRIIRWEKGAGIGPHYAQMLAALEGSEPENFRPAQAGPEFRSLRQQVRQLDAEAKSVRHELAELRAFLEERGIAVPESR